jgi:hypothetical protein
MASVDRRGWHGVNRLEVVRCQAKLLVLQTYARKGCASLRRRQHLQARCANPGTPPGQASASLRGPRKATLRTPLNHLKGLEPSGGSESCCASGTP